MGDFRFLKILGSDEWVISDPNRSKRPNVGKRSEEVCPFCVGSEQSEVEVWRSGGVSYDTNWRIKVIENKFPFAPIHEIVIHSPDHHKNFEELPLSQVEMILRAYRGRYIMHSRDGQVYIFHNRGTAAGESLPHPHSQIAVVPNNVSMNIQKLDLRIYNYDFRNYERGKSVGSLPEGDFKNKSGRFGILKRVFAGIDRDEDKDIFELIETEHFFVFCPLTSVWPDEVWIAPKKMGQIFGVIDEAEISDLAFCLRRVISILDLRYGHEFPFNFYIYPGRNWYLRLIPRLKVVGGFEMGTGIVVNTQDAQKTFELLKEHFGREDLYKIKHAQQAEYWRSV